MAFAFRLAVSRSQISKADEEKALLFIEKSRLPMQIPADIDPKILLEALFRDKKREGEDIKMILPQNTLGEIRYKDLVKKQEIENTLLQFCQTV